MERKKLREQFKREQRQYFEQFCKNPDNHQTDDEVRADIEMSRGSPAKGAAKPSKSSSRPGRNRRWT